MPPFGTGNIASLYRFGFGVGNPAFLSSEESKVAQYWRLIEVGTHGFAGRQLAGLWGNQGGPRGALIAGTLTPFGAGFGQKFVPFSSKLDEAGLAFGARQARKYLKKQGVDKKGRFTRGVVQHEILPHEMFLEGAAGFDILAREKAAIAQAFANSGIFGAPSRGAVASALGRGAPNKVPKPVDVERVANRSGFITVGVLAPKNQGLGNVNGFTDFQAELVGANRILAAELAELIAEKLRESLVRPGVSTKRLEEAILSPQNRFPT